MRHTLARIQYNGKRTSSLEPQATIDSVFFFSMLLTQQCSSGRAEERDGVAHFRRRWSSTRTISPTRVSRSQTVATQFWAPLLSKSSQGQPEDGPHPSVLADEQECSC